MRALQRIAICCLFLACIGIFPTQSLAAPSIIMIRGLDFGHVFAISNSMRIVVDGTGDGLPVCIPQSDCSIAGGTSGLLEFKGFGAQTIRLNFPSEVWLRDVKTHEKIAAIRRMHMRSDPTASWSGFKVTADIGGELFADTRAFGTRLSGTIPISITLE